MKPLARLWTWVGQSFIPTAIGWAFFVRNGWGDKPPPAGVVTSRAYWGVFLTLSAAVVLTWTLALYVRSAKAAGEAVLVPPNTTFEEDDHRSRLISFGTLAAFAVAVLLAVAVFGVRYGESRIHGWDEPQPLQNGFLGSRERAHAIGCADQPCFAIAGRIDPAGSPVFGVNEYILYVTDGALVFLVILNLVGVIAVIRASVSRRTHGRDGSSGPR